MRRWTTDDLASALDTSLRAAGAGALVLSAARARPTIELLTSRVAEDVVVRLPWRSARADSDGSWLAPATVYGFDGGAGVVCCRRRSWSGVWGRSRLLAELAAQLEGRVGLVELDPADEALYAAMELGRRDGIHPARTQALAELLARTSSDEVRRRARRARVGRAVTKAIASAEAAEPPGRAPGSVVARAARSIVRRSRAGARRGGRRTTRSRFDGMELVVTNGVYLPRGVSEPFAQVVSELLPPRGSVVDVGTGCGALALAIAKRRPDARVTGIDIDPRAVRCARLNARQVALEGGGPSFLTGSLLEPLSAERVEMVVGVVPCLAPGDFQGAGDAPSAAYVGATADGLGLLRELGRQAAAVLRPDGWLVVQVSPAQWATLAPELEALGFEPRPDTSSAQAVAIFGQARRRTSAAATPEPAAC